ncbi:cation transporter [candidate division BRC1 bacterium HGW-BRC1-1]|jgi:Ca2+-transporting ATPase|nr:MAG: cation transporter [candidate division BRC1 bacterium HGW-BRC1-1]
MTSLDKASTDKPVVGIVAAKWHALTADEAVARVGSGEQGLASDEAARRLEEYGPNVLPRTRTDGPLKLLWRQINNPLIWVLLGSGVLAMGLGKGTDGVVVLGVVLLNTLIGFVQEYRAGKAIEALSGMVPETATVLRDGERVTLSSSQLAPGDVVVLQSGDKVPADMRLISLRNLRVEEAALTGESVPTEKNADPLPEDAVLGDRRNMAYSGSLVTFGTGQGVVVGTALKTELGRISSLLEEATDIETPLTQGIARVGKWLTLGILLVAAAMFGVGLLRGFTLIDATLAAITLAVAAIPEGLPAIITIALAIGVQRMAVRRAVIRRLPAVETLGSTTVICSDKTGTLTRNEMTVQAVWTPVGSARISGVGYSPEGGISPESPAAPAENLHECIMQIMTAGVLCNDATVPRDENGTWVVNGDPTEGALVVAARKAGIEPENLRKLLVRTDAIPFESEHQFMATLHHDFSEDSGGAGRMIYLKGAPEAVARRCACLVGGGVLDMPLLKSEVERLAAQGMRVLAFARRRVAAGQNSLADSDADGGFELLGLQGMIDPPRAEAIDAIAACHAAGITVKMITGDHRVTAAAIGRQLGILKGDMDAVGGAELAVMDDAALNAAAGQTNVFARVAPEHKLRLVRSLQKQGNVVAMTGDGVNDAPALKQSDIGVAMGITGTAVSKESADIVLTDDNFASITAAVEEGRRVYDNLVKSLAFVLPTNIGEALILLIAVMAFPMLAPGEPLLPMLPTQILWINLVATVTLALPLAFEAMEPDVMRRPPREPGKPIMSKFILMRTILVSLLMTVGALGLFLYEFNVDPDRLTGGEEGRRLAYREAQTMAVTTVVFFQIFYLFNCRSLHDSIFRIGLWSNKFIYVGIGLLIVLQMGFIYLPFMNAAFNSEPLRAWDVMQSVACAMIVLPVISLEKAITSRWAKAGNVKVGVS